MSWSGPFRKGLFPKILFTWLTCHLTTGYNIKDSPQLIKLDSSQTSCFDDNVGKPCDLFGYSISLADQGTYIGSPGKDKGKGAVYKCQKLGTEKIQCTKMDKDNPDKGKV